MDIEQVRLQYQRLERHYQGALNKDRISFLDFSHTLRVWVDMKSTIDTLAQDLGIEMTLNNVDRNKGKKETQKILKGSKYTYLPLASGVPSPDVQVRSLTFTNRALSPDEIKKRYEAGLPVIKNTKLTFSQWLASGIYDVPSENEKHPKLTISREIIIKRVANILGASHPQGTDNYDTTENTFDPYVLDLHQLIIADDYPATYYQLLEIGKDILQAMSKLS